MAFGDADFGLQVSIGTVGKAVGAVVGLVGSIVLARAIGDTGYGAFYFLLAISQFIDNPVTQWAVACRKRMTEADFPTDKAAGAVFLGATVGSVALIVATTVVHFLVGDIRGMDMRLLGIIFLGVVFFTGTKEILAGTRNFGLNSWVELIREIVRVGLQIGLVFLIADVAGMVFGLTLASLLLVPIVMTVSGIRPSFPTADDLSDIFRFAKVSIPNGFVSSALSQVDVIILGALASAELVGNYRVAMNLLFPATFIVATMGPGMMSRVSDLSSRGEDPSLAVTNGLSYVSILALPIAAGAIVMGDLLAVTVYSSQFSEAGMFIGLLGIYFVLQTQSRVLTSTLAGLDRPDLVLKLNAVGFVVNAILGFTLLYTVGPVGIVYATVTGVTLRYVLAALWVRAYLSVNFFPRPLSHQMVAAGIMGAVIFVVRGQMAMSSWLLVVGTVVAGGLLYAGLLLAISKELRQTAVAITRDGMERIA